MLGAGGNPFRIEWSSFAWYVTAGLMVWLALPSLIAVGAILFGKQQHLGIRVMQVGSVFASVFLFPLAAIVAFVPGGPWDILGLALRALFGTTAILILMTDVALVRAARAQRKAQRVPAH